jgi:aspartate racemase
MKDLNSDAGTNTCMDEKVIGILGGMGPEATADLYYRIIKATPAERDQEHIRTVIYSNPKIPDRTKAILGGGESPVSFLVETARKLEEAGVGFIIIPCNTAHYYIDQVQSEVQVPVINMVVETARYISRVFPDVHKVGLLATDGTVKTGLYQATFTSEELTVLMPEPKMQEVTMRAIFSHIKSGNLDTGRVLILEAAENIIDMGAEILVNGCTEISLVIKNGDLRIPVVDPLQVIAEYSVEVALGCKSISEKIGV